jgi:UDP-glucuronate 4-epimerase
MSKILITGGAGFIGAHLGSALQQQGQEVIVLDDFNDFLYTSELKRERLKKLYAEPPQVVKGSVLDLGLLDRAMKENKVEQVLHLAALANPGRSIDAAEKYALVNVLGTNNVLHAAQHNNVQKVIFAGSSSMYDDARTPFSEKDWAFKPRSPYGASKAAAEIYCIQWHRLHGLPVTVLRFFSVYGPWGRPDMAPMILADRLLRGEEMLVTKNRRRDFTYISDIVDGVLAALRQDFTYEVINLGRGEPVDVLEFVQALEAAAGKKASYTWQEAPPGEMEVTCADISKARRLLNYEPKVSVAEGAQKLIKWMRG